MSYLWLVLPAARSHPRARAPGPAASPFRPLVGPFAFSTLALGAWVLVVEGRLAASN
jgi:hypothetical protein